MTDDDATAEPPLAWLEHLPCWLTRGNEKVPFVASRDGWRRADSTDPRDWRRRADAERLAAMLHAKGHQAGVGLAGHRLHNGDHLAFLDLDACVGHDGSSFSAWAEAVIKRFSTYTESSPSGTGLRFVFRLAKADVPAVLDLLRDGSTLRASRKWRRSVPKGEKAEAIEFIWRGYATITGNRLRSQPCVVAYATPDDIRWLFAFAAAFKCGNAAPLVAPEAAQEATGASAEPAPPPDANERIETLRPPAVVPATRPARFISSATRMQRWALTFPDAVFQLTAAFGAVAKKAIDGRSQTWLAYDLLLDLPGANAGSKRSSSTIARTLKEMERPPELSEDAPPWDNKVMLLKVGDTVRPMGSEAPRAAVYAMIPWRPQPPPGPNQPPTVRQALSIWRHAVWTLPPFALRLWAYLIASDAIEDRDAVAAFSPEIGKLAKTFHVKPERITAALDAIEAAGLFEVIERRCSTRRRPATYRRAGSG